MPPESGGVLFVHAHPDDEVIATGGLIARLADAGVRVDLVTCTDGAEGEIHDPDLDVEVARPRLAEIRRRELECSVQALGDGAVHQHLLGYRDSGMIGTDANDHADAFWQASLDEATARLSSIVAAARPAAIVSYDANGNYGHPDHINAHRIARAAYDASLAPGAAHRVSRFYEIAFNRDEWFGLMNDMRERGIELPWDFDARTEAAAAAGEASEAASGDAAASASEASSAQDDFGTPDEFVTTRVDVAAFADRKRRAMDCHRTQRQDMGWLLALPDDLATRALATEHFVLRALDGAPVDPSYREDWVLPR